PAVESMDDAKAYLDVASEIVAGVGAAFELTPRVVAALEAQVFVPLGAVAYGRCRVHDGRACSALTDADYAPTATRGDLTSLVTVGVMVRMTADVTADLMLGTGVGGVRGDDLRISTGIVWAPQPAGVAAPGRRDLDGDGLPDSVDACTDEPEDKDGFEDDDGCPDPDNDQDGIPDAEDRCPNEAEDKDGFQDADGCPDRDNDQDGIPDAADRCAEQPEDKDGFEDDDGCPELDNDGDGFADSVDKCPNDAETVNGVDDDDGCPDVRGTTGPEERVDRIDLKGAPISFTRRTAVLTAPARQVLEQVAGLVRNRKLSLRIEVHVALGTPAKAPGAIAAQKKQDKILAQQRAQAVRDFLVGKGVAATQLQAVGLGADRPLGGVAPTEAAQDRVELIKAQQGGAP
ncbi:MAG: OmpA family protein, partial [Proteobacteria bacterium]|nr:OmpA family protein [Pseudomonadota bacterium]